MKKILCGVCMIVLCIGFVWTEGLLYKVIRKTPLYKSSTAFFSDDNILSYADVGDVISRSGRIGVSTTKPDDTDILSINILHKGENYRMLANDLIPAETKEVFDESFIFDLSGAGNYWVCDYYLDVIRSKNRERLFNYEPYYIDFKGSHSYWYEYNGWWEIAVQAYGSFQFFNTGIIMQSNGVQCDFLIKNITHTETGYNIALVKNIPVTLNIENTPKQLPWYAPYADLEEFTMLVRIDGDYMNVYVNDETQKMCTLVRVNQEFIHQWESLLMTDSCDLSSITFPRYADGTSDYDIREERYQQEGGVYRIQESLRVRNGEGTHSSILTTLDPNTEVTVLRIGSEALIDKIKSNWVHVQLTDGTTGWCFGGYLREETVAESHEKTEELRRVQEAQQEAESKKKAAQDALEQQALAQQRRTVFFIVIGGIVLLAIVISAVVILTQKKQKKQKK